MARAPPPPPPHAPKSSPLPNGNYDVFIIPPHSAGSGFLYLPSLKPNINSFIAGFFTAILCVGLWHILVPALQSTVASLNSGVGILLVVAAVGAAFSFGRTTTTPDGSGAPPPSTGAGPPPNFTFGTGFTPKPADASSSWEKAREETRRREAERKKAEETKANADAATRKKEEAEKAARAAAEKERWEQARAREKDSREKEARDRIEKERAAREAKGAAAAAGGKYQKPTAQSATDSDFYTQYKRPFASSAASVSERSESSYAPSMSTARTTPPPRDRGPYTTSDPNKVVVEGVFLYQSGFVKPTSFLQKGRDGVTDGLILRITTEGLFIDDDVRGVPQREWDVKAWGIKLVEIGRMDGISVFRATMRDTEGKRYLFVLPAEQAWKVDVGLERLRKGSQVRSMGMSTLKDGEMKQILGGLGVR